MHMPHAYSVCMAFVYAIFSKHAYRLLQFHNIASIFRVVYTIYMCRVYLECFVHILLAKVIQMQLTHTEFFVKHKQVPYAYGTCMNE